MNTAEPNEVSKKIEERVSLLHRSLEDSVQHYRHLAKNTHRINVGLMVLTVGLSLVAGIGGLADIIGAKVVGALALLPGLLAIFATTMKFQAKANLHYRRKDALQALRNRLLFELPMPPSDADIAKISQEWSELTNRMNEEWERSLQFNWAQFGANGQQRRTS